MAPVFIRLFHEVPGRRDDAIEQLDIETLRARIGAEMARPVERRKRAWERIDARAASPRRTWRDPPRAR